MWKLVYWVDINADVQKHIKSCNSYLAFQQTQHMEKIICHDIPLRPWEVLGVNIFHFNNKNYVCIIDYHSKLPIIKRMDELSTESLISTTKVIFAEYGILHRLMSDTGPNFIFEKFTRFCSRLNIKQAVSSAYHHQNNGQVKAYIKFIKHTLEKCMDSGGDIYMALLQIHTTPLGQGLPSPETLLFNCPVCSVMPVIDRKPVIVDNDDEHHTKLVHREGKNDTNNDAS